MNVFHHFMILLIMASELEKIVSSVLEPRFYLVPRLENFVSLEPDL